MQDRKASRVFAVSCGESAEVFEFVEALFDAVPLFVEFSVVRSFQLAVAFGWDDGLCSQAL